MTAPAGLLSGTGAGTAVLGAGTLIGRGTAFAQTDAAAADLTTLNSGTLPSTISALFVGNNALTSPTVTTVTAGSVWKVVDGSKNYYMELQPNSTTHLMLRKDDGSRTFRYQITGSFALGDVDLHFGVSSFTDSAGISNTAQDLHFQVGGSTAKLVNPGPGAIVGMTAFGNGGSLDVEFTPATDGGLSVGTITDPDQELDITLADGSHLTINGTPTQPDDLAGTNVFRYSFTGTLVPGLATVRFLDGSFADVNGIANLESTQTFVIATPTAAVNNFASGITYDQAALNDLTKGRRPESMPPTRPIDMSR